MGDALARRRGDYGFDGNVWGSVAAGIIASACLGAAVLAAFRGLVIWTVVAGLGALLLALGLATYMHTTRTGKFTVWAGLLRALSLRGDELLVDVGCGRGAVLLMASRLLPQGRAVGVDVWRASDQSGNAPRATYRNAELEGVRDRVELVTGDMRALPFRDATFDVVVSSLAIHNVGGAASRRDAVAQAIRVLKPGGRMLVADLGVVTDGDAECLRGAGFIDVRNVGLGWRFWYGGPWGATRLVSGTKPSTM